ncbi:hypothetical protein GCM10023195_86110 [Actinoallomurus liliacearum]|uniref:Transcriptional regulator n=1 Tax=Actinoallomurus liliacearum TaxID=1080073 RepID=A0ABP8U1E9_9ACTN
MRIDVARAYAQRRQVDKALAALRPAEEITPGQIRAHPLARRLVSDLMTMQNPPSTDSREIARSVGV